MKASKHNQLLKSSLLSGGGCFRGSGVAGSTAKLPGGGVPELRSLCGVGAAQEGRQAHHGLPVCAGKQQ